MTNYRDSLDALNALVDEQIKTNELLQQLIQLQTIEHIEPKNTTEVLKAQPKNKPIQRKGRQQK